MLTVATMIRMPGCTEVGGLLDAYVDGTASPLQRDVIELHAAACERCRHALRERRCVRRLLRKLPRGAMPDPMRDRLLSAFRASRPTPAPPPDPGNPAPHPIPDLSRPPDPGVDASTDS